jgi:hypothetical protein
MILRHACTIQSRTATTGTEGEQTYTYATLKSGYRCDIQPINASPEELRAWGLVDIAANSRAMFYPHDATILTLMRVLFAGETYEIRNINSWSIHDKALLVPVQGI